MTVGQTQHSYVYLLRMFFSLSHQTHFLVRSLKLFSYLKQKEPGAICEGYNLQMCGWWLKQLERHGFLSHVFEKSKMGMKKKSDKIF